MAVQAGHFQLACGMAFQGVHGCACDTGIKHPNQVQLRWLKRPGRTRNAAALPEMRRLDQQQRHLLCCGEDLRVSLIRLADARGSRQRTSMLSPRHMAVCSVNAVL